MKTLSLKLIFISLFVLSCSGGNKNSGTDPVSGPIWQTPYEVISKIPRGINVGNTLEPEEEGGWNNGPMQEYYFDDIKAAGFSCVRIPVRWDKHTAGTVPFRVQESWMNRVEQVVDWALSRDLYVILNAHHEWWLVNNSAKADTLTRFDSIWAQISRHFRNKSPRLLFEMINEPHGMPKDQVDALNQRILGIIRRSNPQRIVIFSGHEWSNAEQLLQAEVPADEYMMAYYHSYDPWSFAGEGNGTWGTAADVAAMQQKYDAVASWSNANHVPVMISEFGAVTSCDYNSRMLYYMHDVEQALLHGVAFLAWDDGGLFGIYDRNKRTWSEVKDILIHTEPGGPVLYKANFLGTTAVHIQWQNRSDNYAKLIVQRKTEDTDFINLAELDGTVTEYFDRKPTHFDHIYRIISRREATPDKYSNPFRVTPPTVGPSQK